MSTIRVVNNITKTIRIAIPGIQGPPGPPGVGELSNPDAYYLHSQVNPASTWTINHSLNKKPSVTVIDTANDVCIGDVHYVSDTSLTISFTAPFSGSAVLN